MTKLTNSLLRIFVIWMILPPVALWACPLCVNATPYKNGLLWAVGLLIPVPFVLAYLMYGWIRRAS
jgi:hypothetical protein